MIRGSAFTHAGPQSSKRADGLPRRGRRIRVSIQRGNSLLVNHVAAAVITISVRNVSQIRRTVPGHIAGDHDSHRGGDKPFARAAVSLQK